MSGQQNWKNIVTQVAYEPHVPAGVMLAIPTIDNSWITESTPCQEVAPDAFHPTGATERWEIDAAMNLCHECPLQRRCREVAMLRGEHGLWGGVLRTWSIPYHRWLFRTAPADPLGPVDLPDGADVSVWPNKPVNANGIRGGRGKVAT